METTDWTSVAMHASSTNWLGKREANCGLQHEKDENATDISKRISEMFRESFK